MQAKSKLPESVELFKTKFSILFSGFKWDFQGRKCNWNFVKKGDCNEIVMRMFSECSKIVSDLFLRKIFILKGDKSIHETMEVLNVLCI